MKSSEKSSGAGVRRRWTRLDNAAKQALFAAASIFAALYAGAIALVIFADSWAGVAAVSTMFAATLAMGALVLLAVHLYPNNKEQ